MTGLDLSQFDQRWVERRVRGKYCPNWVAHFRIYSVIDFHAAGWFWCVLEPGQLEGGGEDPACREFDTYEEARRHVASCVDAGKGYRA